MKCKFMFRFTTHISIFFLQDIPAVICGNRDSFEAEIFPLHFGLKYAEKHLFWAVPRFFIASAERMLNTLVD